MPGVVAVAWSRLHGALHFRLRSAFGGMLSGYCQPVSIAFLLTERCNARCVHCDIWKNKGRESAPETSEWRKVLRDLRRWLGPVSITFTGGEALLYPHTLELVRYAVSLGFQIEVLSHGYWSDQSKIEMLALANPWRITISLDGIGATHSKIRGREDFFERTVETIDTLRQTRDRKHLGYRIRVKTVIMEHNLDDLSAVAEFASRDHMEVFYQPIEQNYNTPTDLFWFQTSSNWPRDPNKAVTKILELIELKRGGSHIANNEAQLGAMVRYFQDPAGLGSVTRAHLALVRKVPCAALTNLQLQANGDVTVCANRPAIGNIRESPIRQLWKRRAWVWQQGCCLAAGAPRNADSPLIGLDLPTATGKPPVS